MGRYLIIDMDKVRSGECRVPVTTGGSGLNIDLALLSEEETLAKFKEIWDKGNAVGFREGYDGCIDPDSSDNDWNEFKKKL